MFRKFLFSRRSKRGSALIETIYFFPAILILAVCVYWISDILVTRQMLLVAARYGSDMIYYTQLDANRINDEIMFYLTDEQISGKKIKAENIKSINVVIDKKELSLIGLVKSPTWEHLSKVEIEYVFTYPPFLVELVKGMIGKNMASKEFTIKVKSAVLAGFK